MASSIGGYRSPVNLGLGRIPTTTDPELFEELTEVHNSIHLINAYLDRLRIIAEGGGSGQTPAATLPFNRFFVTTALQNIVAGDVVSPSPIAGQNGAIKGALPHLISSAEPLSHFAGIALSGGLAGQDIRVGIGPASLEVPGAVGGSYIWAYSCVDTSGAAFGAGGLYLANPGPIAISATVNVYAMPVAVGLLANYALFGQFYQR